MGTLHSCWPSPRVQQGASAGAGDAALGVVMALFAFPRHVPSFPLRSVTEGGFFSVPLAVGDILEPDVRDQWFIPTAPLDFFSSCWSCSLCGAGDVTIADEAVWDFSSHFKGCWMLH